MAKMAVSKAREQLAEAMEMAHTEAVFLDRIDLRPAAARVFRPSLPRTEEAPY